ncbi:MAG TPA: hypothetical protein VMO26_28305 [Vicinamibacterales bacterium]|nr:hypothetical protein [Vicinamibacterales bacterium]
MADSRARRSCGLALFGLIVATSIVTAQGPDRGQPIRVRPVTPTPERLTPIREGRGAFESVRPGRSSVTVRGIVQNTQGELVPRAGSVRVRSLVDGTVAGRTDVDRLAQFTIAGLEPGIYTAELVGPSGAIIVTSAAFSAGAGEIIQLAPVVPETPASGIIAALGNATTSVVTSAASAGIIAVDPGQPVSPQQP